MSYANTGYEIIDDSPFNDGVLAGRSLGRDQLRRQTRGWLDEPLLSGDLGAMSEAALEQRVAERLNTQPNDAERPELNELYPERLEYLHGLAQGAGCTIEQAATHDYIGYLHKIKRVTALMNPPTTSPVVGGNCSAVLFVGPEGIVSGQNIDSLPTPLHPAEYRDRRPRLYKGLKQLKSRSQNLIFKRPRSGYIEEWGTTNEHGLGMVGGGSCGTWLDDPIVDVWPIKEVPLLRFARSVRELGKLYERYRVYNWGRFSAIWADLSGDAIVVEKTHQRLGIRRIEQGAIWATEGHFQTDEMAAYLRERRLTYVRRQGLSLGADDLQYATDCSVRFTHIGEVAHRDLGRGLEHVRRVLTDHAPFPRAVCRHGGPDTDPYDKTVTLQSTIFDLTANRVYLREWKPWKKFACEVPEVMTAYPPRPCDTRPR